MIRVFMHRPVHWLVLALIAAAMFFPNLGAHSLWDIDESHNAECAREMDEANTWVVPTFNFKLRTDKPVLQYWLMRVAYALFGVSELSARLWSAIAGVGSVLLTYELGRRMFDPLTGLLAGLVLATSFMFCISSHAATPDALLIFFTIASFLVFWWGYTGGSGLWMVLFGLTTGLGVLAKGPVALALPFGTNLLFLICECRLRALWNWRLVVGCVVFGLVAFPWYILVGAETKWEFWQGFFLKHNLERFQSPMEGHRGPIWFHAVALLAAFAPWSCFLGLTFWYGTGRRARSDRDAPCGRFLAPYRLLWCWFGVWLVFFSLASTKLPNYLLPAYPALSLLTARFLSRWVAERISPPRWLLGVSLGCFALVGVCVGAGLFAAAGAFSFIDLHDRELPGVAPLAMLGLIPIAGAALAGYWLLRQRRVEFLSVTCTAAGLLVGLAAAMGPVVVDQHKVTRPMGRMIAEHQVEREVRVGCYRFYQPGLVFYSQRRVEVFAKLEDALDHLSSPLQAFLVVPADDWDELEARVPAEAAVVARRRDFMTGKEIVLVTNRRAGKAVAWK
jgi:4-amino-4-deoxy-L-arabinose transferase-like glycosyltransferase